jgi:hypothetical protein
MAGGLELSTVSPLTYPGWDDLLGAHPEHSYFHTSSWARVLHESYGFSPHYFTQIQNGRLSVLVPVMDVSGWFIGKKGVCLPFSDVCSPIIGAGEDLSLIFEQLLSYGRDANWKSLEIRGNRLVSNETPCDTFFHHELPLFPDEQTMFKSFKNGTKGNIRKAIRENVSVSIDVSDKSLRTFYDLFAHTRQRHGLPPQPFSFFRAVQTHALKQGNGFIALASLNNTVVAGALFLHFGKKAIYKYAASDTTYQNLRANNLVMWEAIKWYCKRGFTSLCLGRTEPNNEGLRFYKSSWNAQERILRYYRYDLTSNMFEHETAHPQRWYSRIFRAMPVPLLKIAGNLLYKYAA